MFLELTIRENPMSLLDQPFDEVMDEVPKDGIIVSLLAESFDEATHGVRVVDQMLSCVVDLNKNG
jgi:hypothetical protein